MKIYLKHVKPLGFKGSSIYENSHCHQTYYRVFSNQCVVVGIDAMSPGIWMVELTPQQMTRYETSKLSIVPPGCCAPGASKREVVEVTSYLYEGPINSQKHLKKLLDQTGLWNGTFISDKLITAKQACESLEASIQEMNEKVKDLQEKVKDLQEELKLTLKLRANLHLSLNNAKRRWDKIADSLV
jgi:hypothetical protein